MRHVCFSVRGLEGELCVSGIVGALAAIRGVSEVRLCVPERRVSVLFDSEKASIAQFERAVSSMGHRAVGIEVDCTQTTGAGAHRAAWLACDMPIPSCPRAIRSTTEPSPAMPLRAVG